MAISKLDICFALSIPFIILLHLFVAPYTKVEESFNVQAIHDILNYGIPRTLNKDTAEDFFASHYDHVFFPGSVPRTFVGALATALVSKPLTAFLASPVQQQLLVRAILGLVNSAAIIRFRYAVDTAYGKTAGRWYLALQASQFHLMYYASRTLPNMFAFPLTTEALRAIMIAQCLPVKSHKTDSNMRFGLIFLTVAGVIFRSEVAILVLAQTVFFLLRSPNPLNTLTSTVIPAGLAGVLRSMAATIFIDSFFWSDWPLWPELQGFYYNTILGHSSEWGTSPFHFYFLNSLPRLLLNPATYLFCMPLAINLPATGPTSKAILAPLLTFVGLYSLLPHKEWRFVIYIIPSLTAVSAAGASYIWTRRAKSLLYRLASVVLVASTVASFAASTGLLYISSLNYPGGAALSSLHYLANNNNNNPGPKVNVYIDNLASQTGVTRFLEDPDLRLGKTGSIWSYNKSENETALLTPEFWTQFDYVLAEDPGRVIGAWEIVGDVEAYAGITLRPDTENTRKVRTVLLPNAPWRVQELYAHFVRYAMQVTGGRWPAVRMARRLYILKQGTIA